MIQIVMKPDYGIKPKGGEKCYGCLFNGEDIGFRVWGRKASHAEEKLMVIFREQLKEKVVDYDIEAYRKSKCAQTECAQDVSCEEKVQEAPLLPGMEGSC